jgi:hypothetical protein
MANGEQKTNGEGKPETITTTIEIDKELFLKFKSRCVLNETTISGEIEKLLKKRVEELEQANKADK